MEQFDGRGVPCFQEDDLRQPLVVRRPEVRTYSAKHKEEINLTSPNSLEDDSHRI